MSNYFNIANLKLSDSNTPSSSNLILWLDAADPNGDGTIPSNNSLVSTWKDKSGKGYHAATTSNQPTYTYDTNGLNAIYFSISNEANSDDFSDNDGCTLRGTITNSNQTCTIFCVCSMIFNHKVSNNGVGSHIDARVVCFYGLNGSTVVTDYDSQSNFYFGRSDRDTGINLYRNNQGTSNNSIGTIFNTTYLFEGWFDNVNMYSTVQIGENTSIGIQTNGYTNLKDSTGNFNFTYYSIGSYANTLKSAFNGYINEIVVYNTCLSLSDRQKVEGYLSWKWNLQNNLPTSHPYSKANNISVFLDSNLFYKNIDNNNSTSFLISNNDLFSIFDKSIVKTNFLTSSITNTNLNNISSYSSLIYNSTSAFVNGTNTYSKTGIYAINNFLYFNNILDKPPRYLSCSNTNFSSILTNKTYTIEAWVNIPITGSNNGVMGLLGINNSSFDLTFVGYKLSTQSVVSTSNQLNDGKWHYVAVTHNNTVVKFYVDGTLISTGTQTLGSSFGSDLSIGSRDYGGYSQNFIGSVAEIRIWNIALSSYKISLNYNNTNLPATYGLIAYYNNFGNSGLLTNGSSITSNNKMAPIFNNLNSFADTFYSSAYGLNIWFDAMDPSGNGTTFDSNVVFSSLKNKGISPFTGQVAKVYTYKSGDAFATDANIQYFIDILNGNPTLNFDGSILLQPLLVQSNNYVSGSKITMFVIGSYSNDLLASGRFIGLSLNYSTYDYDSLSSIAFLAQTNFPNYNLTVGGYLDMSSNPDTVSSSLFPSGLNLLPDNSSYLFEYWNTGSLGTNRIITNADTIKKTRSNTTPTFNIKWYVIGNCSNYIGNNQPFKGFISEILVFNSDVYTTNINNFYYIEGYLSWKWGLQGKLPSSHSYYNSLNYPSLTVNSNIVVSTNSNYDISNLLTLYRYGTITNSGYKINETDLANFFQPTGYYMNASNILSIPPVSNAITNTYTNNNSTDILWISNNLIDIIYNTGKNSYIEVYFFYSFFYSGSSSNIYYKIAINNSYNECILYFNNAIFTTITSSDSLIINSGMSSIKNGLNTIVLNYSSSTSSKLSLFNYKGLYASFTDGTNLLATTNANWNFIDDLRIDNFTTPTNTTSFPKKYTTFYNDEYYVSYVFIDTTKLYIYNPGYYYFLMIGKGGNGSFFVGGGGGGGGGSIYNTTPLLLNIGLYYINFDSNKNVSFNNNSNTFLIKTFSGSGLKTGYVSYSGLTGVTVIYSALNTTFATNSYNISFPYSNISINTVGSPSIGGDINDINDGYGGSGGGILGGAAGRNGFFQTSMNGENGVTSISGSLGGLGGVANGFNPGGGGGGGGGYGGGGGAGNYFSSSTGGSGKGGIGGPGVMYLSKSLTTSWIKPTNQISFNSYDVKSRGTGIYTNYTIFTYSTVGSTNSAIIVNGNVPINVFAVAGGGSGGCDSAGGGGGGGVVQKSINTNGNDVISLTVGAGGSVIYDTNNVASGSSYPLTNMGCNGKDTEILFGNDISNNIIAVGGGAGWSYGSYVGDDGRTAGHASNGGSGGGGYTTSHNFTPYTKQGIKYTSKSLVGLGVPGQGNNGGRGNNGGGGGAGGVGKNGCGNLVFQNENTYTYSYNYTTNKGGNGGDGVVIKFPEISSVYSGYYGGGGGGGSPAGTGYTAGTGGTGGGGNGGDNSGVTALSPGAKGSNGTTGTGGGGGGGAQGSASGFGGNGGSGIIIISVLTSYLV